MWFEAGPFSLRLDSGRVLFSELVIRLEPGSLTAIAGPSGSGKSTLLRQLVGLDASDGAKRLLEDQTYLQVDLPRWRSQVTVLAQDAPMLPTTIAGNLELGFGLRHGRDRTLDPRQRDELLERSYLSELDLERDVSTLSGGERHRLALVRGLLWDPPVLLADEPLTGMDTAAADACFTLLQEQARRANRAVVVILHDPDRTDQAEQRILIDGTGGWQ